MNEQLMFWDEPEEPKKERVPVGRNKYILDVACGSRMFWFFFIR